MAFGAKAIRTATHRLASLVHDTAVATKGVFVEHDVVTITPPRSNKLWENAPATGIPLERCAGGVEPGKEVSLGAGKPYFVPSTPDLSTWYDDTDGSMDLTAAASANLIAGEQWPRALRNDPKDHQVQWRRGAEDMVKGRLKRRVVVNGACATAVAATLNKGDNFKKILSELPDLAIPQLVRNFKLHHCLTEDVVEEVLPNIANNLNRLQPANADDHLKAGAMLVAEYLRADKRASWYLRSTKLGDAESSKVRPALATCKPHIDTCRAQMLNSEGQLPTDALGQIVHEPLATFKASLDALEAGLSAVKTNNRNVDFFSMRFYELTRKILTRCSDEQSRASALAMLVGGIQHYGIKQANKYERHGARISMILQLLGAGAALAPLGGGIPGPFIVIGSSLMDHVSHESAEHLRASMSNIEGKIKGHQLYKTGDTVAKTFSDDLDVIQKVIETEEKARRQPSRLPR